ncbi:hypothetical protein [Macrococcus capreoli]|uniref:hypothetical protein n=1 Tax=Macrococcus capreoli TaxID=2982690 RepID=UPI003EE7947F
MEYIGELSKQAVEEIDNLKKAVYKFDIRINELVEEIAKDTDEYNQLEEKYSDLVSNGEDKEADILYGKLDELKTSLKAKNNRHETMKVAKVKALINNCRLIEAKSRNIYLSYREDYKNVYEEAKKLHEELNEKLDELKSANKTWNYHLELNSRFIDHQLRKNDIHRSLVNVHILPPYMTKPFNLDEMNK